MIPLVWLTLWPLWCALLLAPAIMMSPGCGCCNPINCGCEAGTHPATVTVVVADIANSLPGRVCCEALNGTYICAAVEECLWRVSWDSVCGCNWPDYTTTTDTLEVFLEPDGANTKVTVTLTYWVWHGATACGTPGTCWYHWDGTKYVLQSGTPCASGCVCEPEDVPSDYNGDDILLDCKTCSEVQETVVWQTSLATKQCDFAGEIVPFLSHSAVNPRCACVNSTATITGNAPYA